jgi:hypothetical protein
MATISLLKRGVGFTPRAGVQQARKEEVKCVAVDISKIDGK